MSKGRFSLNHHPLLRVAIYYVSLTLVTWGVWAALPPAAEDVMRRALSPILGTSPSPATSGSILEVPQPAMPSMSPPLVAIMTLVAGLAGFALSLPVAWVYMFTRQRKGYSQSVVQALVLMPVVIAVVAALVRNSIALAFSLAGIIAAVRFRTNLDDSRDAVFMFVVTAMGLACGVQLEVAGVLSLLFVVLTLGLWFTDFARVPPALEGLMAERRLARAMAMPNRTSQFVARLDHDVIEGMAPAQLESLARRIDGRRKELGVENGTEEEGPRYDGRVRLTVKDQDTAQPVIENLFEQQLKRWKQVRVEHREDMTDLVYAVRLRKGRELSDLKDCVLRDGAPHVISVEVGAWV